MFWSLEQMHPHRDRLLADLVMVVSGKDERQKGTFFATFCRIYPPSGISDKTLENVFEVVSSRAKGGKNILKIHADGVKTGIK